MFFEYILQWKIFFDLREEMELTSLTFCYILKVISCNELYLCWFCSFIEFGLILVWIEMVAISYFSSKTETETVLFA